MAGGHHRAANWLRPSHRPPARSRCWPRSGRFMMTRSARDSRRVVSRRDSWLSIRALIDGVARARGSRLVRARRPAQLKDLPWSFEVMRALGNFDIGQAVASSTV